MNRQRRRRYLIDKKIQLKYVVFTVALLLLYTLILLAAVFVPQARILSSPEASFAMKAEAATAYVLLDAYLWPWAGLIIILFGAASIFITHKIAGPLFAVRRVIARIADGDLTARVKLRRRDELHDLADAMNRMTGKLELLFSGLSERIGSLSSHARQLSPENVPAGRSKILAEVEEVEKVLEQCKFEKKRKA